MKVKILKLLLALFFVFPFIVLFYYFRIDFNFKVFEVLWALKNSLIQSFSTALLSVFFGFFGALGLIKASARWQKVLKLLILIPVFLPSLFTILIGISIANYMPLGSLGIIYFMTLIHIGFAASIIFEEITSQIGQLGLVAESFGINKLNFLVKVLWPLVRKSVGYIFVMIFVNTMTAFTIPLIVGAGRGTNLEVLIYEKIFIEQNWANAIGLGLVQLLIIAGFAVFLNFRNISTIRDYKDSRLVGSFVGLAGLIIYLILYFWGYFKLFLGSLEAYYITEIFNNDLIEAISNSFILFSFCLIVFSFLFLSAMYLKFNFQKIEFLNFFINPSSVLVGFGFYLFIPNHNYLISILKLSLVIGSVSFVGFMKLVFENQMHLFESQIKVARSFNINFLNFIFKIYFPQIKKRLHFACSLLLVFSISEYGLIKSSGVQIKTLGTEMASYLSSYRSEGAFVISLIILTIWLIVTIISGGFFGLYKKS